LSDKHTLQDLLEIQQHFGLPSPAYAAEPVDETLKAVEGIATDADYRTAYAGFCRDMVYGDDVPDFDTAVATLKALAQHLKQGKA
jgi:hypothetical protein